MTIQMAPATWSVRMADSVMRRNAPYRWHYECGLMHRAIEQVWLKTDEAKYYAYVKRDVDAVVAEDGSIKAYAVKEYNLDQINPDRNPFMLHRRWLI